MAVITLTKENFQSEAVQTSQTVLIDFGQHGADHAACFLLL